MKKYVNAEIEVLVFAAEDILTSSAGAQEEATTTWETYAKDKFDYVPGQGEGDAIDF